MQQKKTFAILLSLAMIVTIVLGNGTFVSAATTEAITGISYYVDSVNGNDDNDGTSEAKAWKSLEKVNATTFKPGDKLRFKRGCSWSGLLSPKGSGEKGNPITIDAYGDVKDGRPVINGDSWCGDKGDDLENRVFNTAVYFYNQEYWEITSIEVTNHTKTKDDHIKKYGILIMGQDAGTLHEINVKNTYVHDVISIPIGQQAGIGRGGIVYAIRGNKKATNWEDITVEGNYVKNVNHYGINFISTWGSSTFPDESGITEGGGGTYRSKNLVIRSNYCENVGNAAICPSDYENALIEYNVANGCNSGPNGNVPIWWEHGQKTICQYNEVFGSGASGDKEDSQAFDADVYADLNYVQYNYTHDNPSGSFFECALGTSYQTYYRYNISVNDGYGTNRYGGGAVLTLCQGGNGSLDAYNNLIYMDADHDGSITRSWDDTTAVTSTDRFKIRNNVIITEAQKIDDNGVNKAQAWDSRYMGVVNNNAYGGANLNNRRADDENAKVAVKSDYVKLEEGTSATVEDVNGEFKITYGTVDGYKLKDGATVIDQGISVIDNGGQDFYGNEVKSFVKPNIGADNSYNSGIKEDLGEGKILLDFDDCNNGALTGVYSNCDFGNRGWNVTDGKLWATSYTNEEQANKLAIPDKYAVTSFEAYCAKGTATVKVEAGEESETFTVTNDMHYDHAYFGLFGIEAIKDIQAENNDFQPTVHEAIIHSHMTDEVYPKDQGNYGWNHELDTYLGAWQHLDGLEEKTMLNWSERENVLTPYSMRQGPFKYNLKDQALRKYSTEYYNWIASFSKVNEVFYKHETNSIGSLATVTASSENSSDSRWDDQSVVKAVDGVADGYATGLANLHTRFPWAEWATKNEGAGAWLSLAYDEVQKVTKIKIYDRPNTDDHITNSHLEFDDGTTLEVGELPNDGSVKEISLGEGKEVKNIKFVVDEVSESTTAVGLAEIEVIK